MAQKTEKRENLERTERTEERTQPLISPYFSDYLKNIWRELLHQSSAVDQILLQRGVIHDYRKLLQ